MSTEQKKFIRTILIIVISAIVAQVIVGFGILNRDHFTIKSNNEKILEINQQMKQKLSYDAFNQYMKFKKEENDLLRQLIQEIKNENKDEVNSIEEKLTDLNRRVDQLFIEFGIGTVRGEDDFTPDIMPDYFKTES